MNDKGMVIGGLVATVLPFILALGLGVCPGVIQVGLGAGLGLIWLDNRILTLYLFSMFIGAAIAGVMSINKSDSWKDGTCAVVLMEVVFLVSMYFNGLLFNTLTISVIKTTPLFPLVGAVGGFIGGRMKS